LWLNNELLLLHGLPNIFATICIECLFSPGSWFTQSIRLKNGGGSAFGQVTYNRQRSKINWLLDCSQANRGYLGHLVDNLVYEAGLKNSRLMLASSEPDQHLFSILRQAGFCVYGWEKYWKVIHTTKESVRNSNFIWQRVSITDVPLVSQFQVKHLSPTIRSVTPQANEIPPDFVLWQGKQIRGYAYVRIFFEKGIITPILDPDIHLSSDIMAGLLIQQSKYISSWYIKQIMAHSELECILSELAIPISRRRELMVKHFTIMNAQSVELYNHAREKSHANPITPFFHSNKTRDHL